MSCALLGWSRVPPVEWPRFLAGLTSVSADGTTLATAMGGRAGTTMLIVASALLVAVTAGFAVAFFAMRIRCGLPWLAGFIARFAAALPVAAIGWMAVGWIVGQNGWSIESLVPNHPPTDKDSWEFALGRRAWFWAVPCWVLALPLVGECATQVLDVFSKFRRSELHKGLRARGLKRSLIHYHHDCPAVWPELLDMIEALGPLAFGYVVFVEDALAIPGWGSFFANALKTGDAHGIAGSIYAAGWLTAAWCLCIGVVRRLSAGVPRPSQVPDQPPATVDVKKISTIASVLLAAFFCCSFGGLPQLTASAACLASTFAGYASPLVGDLRSVSAALAVALILTLVRSAFSLAFRKAPPPGGGLLETLSWSPLLVWLIGISTVLKVPEFDWVAPGVAAAFGGAVHVRNRWRELQSSRALEASRAVGTGRLRAWRMHVLPDLFRTVLAWMLHLAATLMVWFALIDTVKQPAPHAPATSLGTAIAAAKENVLSDLQPMLIPALLTAICALFFRQLSRIVRPAPPPHPH